MPAEKPLAGRRIVVLDDNADSLEITGIVLSRAGAEVVSTSSPGDAITAVEARHTDAIVSDLSMPGEDGFGFVRRLASVVPRSATVPKIALSGFAASEDRARALAAGFSMHVAKPVDPPHLVAVLAALIDRRRAVDDNTDEPTVRRSDLPPSA